MPSTKLKNGSLIGVYRTIMNNIVPTKLKNVWNMAVCLPVLDAPIEAIQDVKHVPTFAPTTKHNALDMPSVRVTRNTTIEVTTVDDWKIIVNPIPIAIRSNGLLVELKIMLTNFWNDSFSVLSCNNCRPINKIPKPAMISPNILSGFFFERSGIAPTNAKNAKYGVRLRADKETINVVTVVPKLAPMIQAHAWNNVIVPISVNLTKVTEVTSEDCTNAV